VSAPATSPQPAVRDAAALAKSFEAFTRISNSLQRAYDDLRSQAARIDLALAQTNERLAEKVAQLDATTSHLDAVLGSLATAVVVTDLDGRVTLANRSFAQLCGRDAATLPGTLERELRDEQGRLACVAREDGLPRVVRASKAPVVGKDGTTLGEVETFVDETEVEALREELRRRETLTALGEMAAGIAHEIRNPLQAIEGFAGLLEQSLQGDDAAGGAHARRIRLAVRKANSIITNLLSLARPERFRPRRSRLAALFAELRATFAAAENGVASAHVEVRSPEPLDLEVACDLALIERVLVNLVDNARHAAGPDGRVVVRARSIGGDVVLTVEDDGPGIAPELRAKLFRPFVTGRAEGTGLGLFLVHRIVELHRGRVDASDRVGGGTTFTVRLPDRRHDEVPTWSARPLAMEGSLA
jgi:signal transduction histidine kinase